MGDSVIAKYANVEVGMTTGANNYFTVPESVVNMYQLHDFAHPMVGRSVQVNSLRFTPDDWRNNVVAQAKAFMLIFTPGAKQNANDGVKAYIENGEKEGVNRGYKTSIRDDWYVIPSVKLSDALFLRRNNMFPKFVLNEANAYTTDTMHRVFIHPDVNKKALVASYYNSLSFTFAEILGRNFGGGCLELMPSEVGGIFIPYDQKNEDLFDTIDKMLRQDKTADEILDTTDKILLHERMGFTIEEVKLARSIWHKIMGKRLGRQQAATTTALKATPKVKATIKQLDMFEALQRYPEYIVDNVGMVNDFTPTIDIDISRHVLVSLVKDDNTEQYVNRTAKIYYSGKKFPSTVSLDKLYYFMPYFKKKGIRDLYLIRKARIGTRKEGQANSDATDYRLVFEIKFVCQLYSEYKPVDLHIWHTFTDTTLSKLEN